MTEMTRASREPDKYRDQPSSIRLDRDQDYLISYNVLNYQDRFVWDENLTHFSGGSMAERQKRAPPLGRNPFIFMQFTSKNLQSNRLAHCSRELEPPVWEILDPPLLLHTVFKTLVDPGLGQKPAVFFASWVLGCSQSHEGKTESPFD